MATVKRPSEAGLDLDVRRLCEAIDRERQRRGRTYQDVAAELGVTYSTLCYWRRGNNAMTARAALRISVWLSRDLRMFTSYTPADPPPATGKAA